jgi:hypothetical protein
MRVLTQVTMIRMPPTVGGEESIWEISVEREAMIAKRFKRRASTLIVLTCLLLASPGATTAAGPSGKLEFALSDTFGRKVHSQDYAGVPVFLEFGPCW